MTDVPPRRPASAADEGPDEAGQPVDTARIVGIGTGAFLVAFVVLGALRLADVAWAHAHPTWLWTCLAGWVLGLMGYAIVRRHRREGRSTR